jgi:hypothetical protein
MIFKHWTHGPHIWGLPVWPTAQVLFFFKFSCLSHLVPTTLDKEHSRAVRRGLRRRSSRFSVVTKAGLENRQPPKND